MVANVVGAPSELLGRSSMFDHAGPAKRPQDCSLVSEKIRCALGITPARCAEGLSELVQRGVLTALKRT
jgi:dTDP-4-dehydrorhamnose reductase